MKKLFFAVAAACGCAFFAYAEQVQNWFSGGVENSAPTAVNGAWTSPSEGVTTNTTSFTLELGCGETLDFTPTANAAPDTNVMTRVTVTAAFVPATFELPALPAGAKTALTVSNDVYCAHADGVWVELTGATPPANEDEAVVVLSEVDYKCSTPRARFGIITNNGATTNYLKAVGADDNSWLELGGTTPNPALVGKVSFFGEGELKSVSGDVQLGVALYENVKYPGLQDAINEAGEENATITLLRNTTDTVEVPANVTIDTNGKKMAGEVTVAAGATLETTKDTGCIDLTSYHLPASGTVNLKLTDASNTVVNGECVVAIGAKDGDQNKIAVAGNNGLKSYSDLRFNGKSESLVCCVTTSDAQVNAVTGGGVVLTGTSNSDLREFLNQHATTTYNGAGSSSDAMTTALAATGGNGYPLWQDFVLGIKPTDTLATQPTGTDNDPGNLHISIPAVTTKDSGYTVTYKVNNTAVADPKDIQISVGTGTYAIKAVLTPKAK